MRCAGIITKKEEEEVEADLEIQSVGGAQELPNV